MRKESGVSVPHQIILDVCWLWVIIHKILVRCASKQNLPFKSRKGDGKA